LWAGYPYPAFPSNSIRESIIPLRMTLTSWITLAIVLVTYLGIAAGRWPLLKANRATLTLIGVGLLLSVARYSERCHLDQEAQAQEEAAAAPPLMRSLFN